MFFLLKITSFVLKYPLLSYIFTYVFFITNVNLFLFSKEELGYFYQIDIKIDEMLYF